MMADIVDRITRSRMMSQIRGKNTKPELLIRHHLFRLKFRFRLHDKKYPGTPDLILRKYSAAIFIHGCFWHGHDCRYFTMPKTNRSFWEKKLRTNMANDVKSAELLLSSGWRVCWIWECSTRGKSESELAMIADRVAKWIRSDHEFLEIREG